MEPAARDSGMDFGPRVGQEQGMSRIVSSARALARAFVACSAVGIVACSTPAPRQTEPVEQPSASASTPADDPAASQPAAAPPAAPATPARPAVRRLFAAHPRTVARQVPADNDARIEAHLAAHPETPADIAAAIRGHELWVGMTEAEVVLSVGPATRREPVSEDPGAYGLFYAGEGWFLSFDENGYLYSVVER